MKHLPPILGTFLLDQSNGQLIAMDSSVVARLSLGKIVLGLSKLTELIPSLTKQELTAILDQNDKKCREFTTLIRGTDGSETPVSLRAVPLLGTQRRTQQGTPQRLVLLTIHPEAVEQEEIAQLDALTGLPDRRALATHHQRWQRAEGIKAISFAVLFMDLDQFKQINDQHGHAVGDQVLIELAKRWQSCVREGDLVVRYGGDEFVILLAGITRRGEVEPVLTRITDETSRPIPVGEEQLQVGVTIGMAIAGGESNSLEQLIDLADREMYASKAN